MNEHQRLMLRAIVRDGQGRAKQFTHGVTSIAPSILVLYLTRMVDAGLIEQKGDIYTPTDAGRKAAEEAERYTPPRTIVNAASAGIYRPSWAPVRAGADDHKECKSLTPFRG